MRAKKMTTARFCKLCLEVFDEVHETGRPYMITKNGRGLIKVLPLENWEPPKRRTEPRRVRPCGAALLVNGPELPYIS